MEIRYGERLTEPDMEPSMGHHGDSDAYALDRWVGHAGLTHSTSRRQKAEWFTLPKAGMADGRWRHSGRIEVCGRPK